MADLKNNRTIQFAVGATVIFLFLRWVFTGDLLTAVDAATPPAEGETKSVSFLSALWPMVVEGVVIVGVSVIAFALHIWAAVVEFIDSLKAKNAASPAAVSVQASVAGFSDSHPGESRDGLVTGLAQAVAVNDADTEKRLRTAIRRPYAIGELNTALSEGDFQRAEVLMSEIKILSGER